MIVVEVSDQDASQMPLAKDDDMIEALAPDRPNEPLREGVLPRMRRRQDFSDAHTLETMSERLAVDRVAVAEKIGGGRVVPERVHDLLGRPRGSGMLGYVEVDDTSAVMGKADENKGHPQARAGHGEEVSSARSNAGLDLDTCEGRQLDGMRKCRDSLSRMTLGCPCG